MVTKTYKGPIFYCYLQPRGLLNKVGSPFTTFSAVRCGNSDSKMRKETKALNYVYIIIKPIKQLSKNEEDNLQSLLPNRETRVHIHLPGVCVETCRQRPYIIETMHSYTLPM